MRPGHRPRTTTSPPADTSALADTNAAPRRSSGTSRSCASSSALLAASSPCIPAHRADNTPGIPFSASTSQPGIVCDTSQSRRRERITRLRQCVLLERRAGLGRLVERLDVVERHQVDPCQPCGIEHPPHLGQLLAVSACNQQANHLSCRTPSSAPVPRAARRDRAAPTPHAGSRTSFSVAASAASSSLSSVERGNVAPSPVP